MGSQGTQKSSDYGEVKGHAVVFAWPGQGHLNPLFVFSQLLASHGFFVSFVHTQHNLTRMASLPSLPHNFQLLGIPDGLPPDHPRDVLALIRATDGPSQPLAVSFEHLVDQLVHQEHNPATCIVSDLFMVFTQDVANKFALPRVAVFIQSASSLACHLAVCDGFKPSQGDTVIDCIPGVPPLQLNEMISFLQCYDPSDAVYDYMIRPFKRIDEPASIVLNTFKELERDALKGLQNRLSFYCGGPFLPSSFYEDRSHTATDFGTSLWAEDHDCLKWLDSRAPSSVLYLSFGSLGSLSAKQTEELALGLESSEQPFLWAIRPGLLEAGLPEGFEARVRNRACFVSWAPQSKVLRHSSTGGFLTHCGWNSVLESISAGVPMLGLGGFADQKLNQRCVADKWKVGLFLSSEDEASGLLSRDEVERKVRLLMAEERESMTGRCEALSKAARENASTEHYERILNQMQADLSKRTNEKAAI